MMDDKVFEEVQRVIRNHDADVIISLFEHRARQNLQWGGADHDDQLTAMDWTAFLDKQMDKLRRSENEGKAFQKLIEIAALAVSGAEALRRRHVASCIGCQLEKMLGESVEVRVVSGADAREVMDQLIRDLSDRSDSDTTH